LEGLQPSKPPYAGDRVTRVIEIIPMAYLTPADSCATLWLVYALGKETYDDSNRTQFDRAGRHTGGCPILSAPRHEKTYSLSVE
jgi:hypothetical protein